MTALELRDTNEGDPRTFQEILSDLAEAELQDSWHSSLSGVIIHSKKALYKSYRQTTHFRHIYGVVEEYLFSKRRSYEEVEKCVQTHLGVMYEGLAYMVTSKRQEREEIVLSPDRTLAFMKELYPHQPLAKNMFTDSLMDMWVPDGIGVVQIGDTWRIRRLYEYTTYGHLSIKQNQADVALCRKEFPQLFTDDTSVRYVVPKDSKWLDTIGVESLPFSRDNLRNFVYSVYRINPFDQNSVALDSRLVPLQQKSA